MVLRIHDDIEVVAEAGTGLEAIEVARQHRPDVILMDIRMPDMDGLEATSRILAEADWDVRVLILTTFDPDEYVYQALRAGASGFVLKDIPPRRAGHRRPHRGRRRGAAGTIDHPASHRPVHRAPRRRPGGRPSPRAPHRPGARGGGRRCPRSNQARITQGPSSDQPR